MLIRFVIVETDPESHRLGGIFNAACNLCDRGVLDRDEHTRLEALLAWFNRHLPVPSRFSRQSRPRDGRAICWFKHDAAIFIRGVWHIVSLLERNGVTTKVLRTRRPGYVLYEDEFQVVAVPFRDTVA